MAGHVSGQGIPSPLAVPGVPTAVQDLIDEYPELAQELLSYTSWRDVSNYDRHSKGFERQFPSMKPRIYRTK